MKNNRSWPDEDFELAAAMWRDGKSGEEIGRKIGKTRNAVIAMMNKKGVQTPTPPRSRGRGTIRKPEPPRPPHDFRIGSKPQQEVRSAPVALELPSAPAPLNVAYADLEDGMCYWPVAGQKQFCGAATARGRIYCPYHERAKTAKGMAAIKAAAAELSASAQ